MSRKYNDCRDYPSDINCSIALSADTDDELLEVTPLTYRIRKRILKTDERGKQTKKAKEQLEE